MNWYGEVQTLYDKSRRTLLSFQAGMCCDESVYELQNKWPWIYRISSYSHFMVFRYFHYPWFDTIHIPYEGSRFIQIKNSMKVRKQIIFKIYNLLKKLHRTNKCKKNQNIFSQTSEWKKKKKNERFKNFVINFNSRFVFSKWSYEKMKNQIVQPNSFTYCHTKIVMFLIHIIRQGRG